MSVDGPPLRSCLYHGIVRHRRATPIEHDFRHRLFLTYLDLDEVERVFSGRLLWSAHRPAAARFCREDYLGEPHEPLAESVRNLVEDRLGSRPTGPVCLLTNLRYFGYILNPISLYYCFDADGLRVQTVVAEVTNTPWGERHCYVISGPEQKSIRVWRTTTNKDLHVSPFLPMDMTYHWRLSTPGGRLSVHIENHRQGVKVFDATLLLTRRPITTGTLAAALARHPWMTGKAVAGIYWQALKLWWKGAPFITHPKAAPNASAAKVVSTPH